MIRKVGYLASRRRFGARGRRHGAASSDCSSVRPLTPRRRIPIGSSACSATCSSKVRTDYVEKPDEAKLIEAAINGMLTSLDPHSSYMDAKELPGDADPDARASSAGLASRSRMEEGLIKVVTPIDDTPAARAGMLAGDIITQIDGEPVQGLTLDQAVDKMRGPVNSSVKLTIQRKEKKEPLEVKLTREIIRIQPVRARSRGRRHRLPPHHAVHRADRTRACAPRSKSSEGIPADKLKGYVIDLRNNPGGLLDQAIMVSTPSSTRARSSRPAAATPRRRSATTPSARRRSVGGQAAGGAHQRRLGLGLGDRGRRAAGPQARDRARHALVRQGLGADHHPARRATARCA